MSATKKKKENFSKSSSTYSVAFLVTYMDGFIDLVKVAMLPYLNY